MRTGIWKGLEERKGKKKCNQFIINKCYKETPQKSFSKNEAQTVVYVCMNKNINNVKEHCYSQYTKRPQTSTKRKADWPI